MQSLTSLSVDFTQTPPVAYTTSEPFSWVYACDTSQTGQSITTPYYDDTQQTGNSLLFSGANLYTSGGVSTLYLLSKTESEGSSNIVLSTLVVSGTSADYYWHHHSSSAATAGTGLTTSCSVQMGPSRMSWMAGTGRALS